MEFEALKDREKTILRYIVQQFILTAAPVGSRNITKKYDIGFSSATVRNIMADLEDYGFISHPHTSAGRVPTDKGYRFYVDSLIDLQLLNAQEQLSIQTQLKDFEETDELLQLTSKILSLLTNQLACVVYPNLDTGMLEKLQLVSLSSNRILVVISIKAGIVKTLTLEMTFEIDEKIMRKVEGLLNERLAGLTLAEIKSSFKERLKDVENDTKPIINVFYDSVDKIFTDPKPSDKVVLSGASNLIRQPEFENPEKFQSVIELIEDKNIIIHIFEKTGQISDKNVKVSIGQEVELEGLDDYSFVAKDYKIGNTSGTLGITGPKRMEYSKIMAIVDYVANVLTDLLTKPQK